MNTEDQNQDFAKLQQLLKLKRYETPPPRYFNDFSGQVTSRIRAGKTGGRYESFDNIVAQTPWLHRVWQLLERQPALSGAVAAVVCGLSVAGVFLLDQTTPPNFSPMALDQGNAGGNNLAAAAALGNNFAAAPQLFSSTNTAALLTGPNLFDRMPTIQTVPTKGTSILQK
jgi:hypothetical protein